MGLDGFSGAIDVHFFSVVSVNALLWSLRAFTERPFFAKETVSVGLMVKGDSARFNIVLKT